ncbi:3-hydroxyisobutyryl-CoA hydrolase, mitochondrial-like [Portunus trituberculatus]|uniref:3-hydroxyisobutyryl-CoA hydrolase, mitochondrial-like n=1 Tax=Portunus trituberculatus TaxID=210409 RepID=UPI001E1CC1C4|nr:3-hydroxyisobutyryl-CoA hydrolase, mitochondrial-like [Portunus trituberculatus]
MSFCQLRSLRLSTEVVRPLLLHARTMHVASEPVVILHEVGDKGVITLNRPRLLNALNHEMVQLIHPRLREWKNTKKLVIIKGTGDKAFCAGGDVRAVVETIGKPDALGEYFFRDEYMLNYLIGTLRIPYIALIDGFTMGGGAGLSVHGQYRVATERTIFAMPEVCLGLAADVGGSHFLPTLRERLGTYLALTGHRLKGPDVLKAGVATHVCDGARIAELEESLLDLRFTNPENVAAVLQKFHKEATFNKDAPFSLQPVLPKIESCFSGATVEEIFGNLEKDGSEWALKQLETLNRMPPLSLKLTCHMLERGACLTLQECLAMEYRTVKRLYKGHNFIEGTRSVLVDRDYKPQWKPKTLEEITSEKMDEYFAPLPDGEDLEF